MVDWSPIPRVGGAGGPVPDRRVPATAGTNRGARAPALPNTATAQPIGWLTVPDDNEIAVDFLDMTDDRSLV